MPTGYTAGVASGEIKDFNTYALMCARAFGACVTLRDDPLSSDIPMFEVSEHTIKAYEQAKQDWFDFENMSDALLRTLYFESCCEKEELARQRIEEKELEKSRYMAMLEQALKFVPPTIEHAEYAKFIVEQLTESIRFDCDDSYYRVDLGRPSFAEWFVKEQDARKDRYSWYENHLHKETESVKKKNQWIQDLKNALLTTAN